MQRPRFYRQPVFCVRLANPNTGRAGGALLTSGVTKIYGCLFSGNRGYTGPAISNTVLLDIHSTEFDGNALLCGDGFFLDWANVSDLSLVDRASGDGYKSVIRLHYRGERFCIFHFEGDGSFTLSRVSTMYIWYAPHDRPTSRLPTHNLL